MGGYPHYQGQLHLVEEEMNLELALGNQEIPFQVQKIFPVSYQMTLSFSVIISSEALILLTFSQLFAYAERTSVVM